MGILDKIIDSRERGEGFLGFGVLTGLELPPMTEPTIPGWTRRRVTRDVVDAVRRGIETSDLTGAQKNAAWMNCLVAMKKQGLLRGAELDYRRKQRFGKRRD